MASQTAQEVITRALRRIKCLAASEAMGADDLSDGLRTMNGAMHGFGPKGIKYVHADLTATATVNMPDELIDSLVWMIADALAPEYEAVLSPRDLAAVMDAKNMLQAAYWMQAPAESEPYLRPRPVGFNITRGE